MPLNKDRGVEGEQRKVDSKNKSQERCSVEAQQRLSRVCRANTKS